MLAGVLRASLPALLASTIGLPIAHADIFTWVDASGTTNVSNLVPPDGVRVTKVIHENAPKGAARDAELQALAARVRQLEDEVAAAKPQTPPQVVYQGILPPPAMQYAGDWAPSPTPYEYAAAPPASAGCNPTWMDCGLWWGPGFFPARVIVLRAPKSRRFFPVRVEHHIVAHQPAGPPRGVHRG